MNQHEQLHRITKIIESLPLGRMRADYAKKREETILTIRKREEESEITEQLVDIAKQMNVNCFMCKAVIKKFEGQQVLSNEDKLHISNCVPPTVRLKGFKGKVIISIDLFIDRINSERGGRS